MRISNSLMISQSALDISLLFERINKARGELSSGKRINQPSDDPVSFSEAAQIKRILNTNEIIKTNIGSIKSYLEVTEGVLHSVKDIIHRGKQLAVRGSTDVLSSNDRQLIVEELNNLIDQTVGLGNTRFGDSYLFGGQRTTTQPFTPAGSPIQNVTYQGDGNIVFRDIGLTQLFPVNFPGDQVFMGGANQTKNVFLALINLRDQFRDDTMFSLTPINNTNQTITAAEAGATLLTALNASNELATPVNNGGAGSGTFTVNSTTINFDIAADTINDVLSRINASVTGVTASYDDVTQRVVLKSATGRLIDIRDTKGNFAASMHLISPISHFDTALENITDFLGRIGGGMRQLEVASTQNNSQFLSFTASLSRVEDTDAARRITELSLSTTTFQAALNVTSRTIPQTLLDFLR